METIARSLVERVSSFTVFIEYLLKFSTNMADRSEMEGEVGRKFRSVAAGSKVGRKLGRRAEEKEKFRNSLGIGSNFFGRGLI